MNNLISTCLEVLPLLMLSAAPADSDCRECHQAIYDTYQSVGMSHSMYRPQERDPIEDFANAVFHHKSSGMHYETVRRDGKWYQRRYTLDEQGDKLSEFEQEITHIIGSGKHVRTYIHVDESGAATQLPVSWYTQEKKWAMSPGYDHPNHDDFSRDVEHDCIFCHNAYPTLPKNSDEYGRPARFPQGFPSGIGCARCHGDATKHTMLARKDDATLKQVRESIVNPRRMTPDDQLAVCMQCHLQPSSKHSSRWRRFGRTAYDHQPGHDLSDFLVVFDYPQSKLHKRGDQKYDEFEIDHHAYRMRRSKCFSASDGGLTCTSCHDPHRVIPKVKRADFYRDKCLTCHQMTDCDVEHMAAEAKGVAVHDCVTCHMPQRRTQDVVHVVMTDHYIRRHPPEDDLTTSLEETPSGDPGKPVFYFDQEEDLPPADERDLYLGIVGTRDGHEESFRRLESSVPRLKPDALEPYMELALAQLSRNRTKEALDTMRLAHERFPNHPIVHHNLALALAATGDATGAVESFQNAIKHGGTMPETQYGLATLLARMRDTESAVQHYRRALELDPDYAAAHFNLGNLLARAGRMADALDHFQSAANIKPTARHHYSLGLALRDTGNPAKAIRHWKQAARLEAMHPNAHRLLADAYAATGDWSNAAREYRLAAQADPNRVRLHLDLARALARTGDDAEAIGILRKWVAARPRDHAAVNDLAYLLATSDKQHLRNPQESLELARRLTTETDEKSAIYPTYWDTLARAYLAVGDRSQAIEAMQTGIDHAVKLDNQEILAALQNHLESISHGPEADKTPDNSP
jgi:tetratricopeptide (TPR) repeat protein